jgi:hypothetical protein
MEEHPDLFSSPGSPAGSEDSTVPAVFMGTRQLIVNSGLYEINL